MYRFKIFTVFFLVTFFLLNQACAADVKRTREQLEARKLRLEEQLVKITSQLAALEGESTISITDTTGQPTHYIDAFGIYDVDSAGGVQPSITFVNQNKKSPLKYAKVSIQLYDRVGNVLRSSVHSEAKKWLNFTGPLEFGATPQKSHWDPVWYNHSGWCIRIISLQIEFLDKSRQSFSGRTLDKALKPSLKNECTVDGFRYQE